MTGKCLATSASSATGITAAAAGPAASPTAAFAALAVLTGRGWEHSLRFEGHHRVGAELHDGAVHTRLLLGAVVGAGG